MKTLEVQFISEVIRKMPDFAPTLRAQKSSCAQAFMKALSAELVDFDNKQFLIDCGVNDRA